MTTDDFINQLKKSLGTKLLSVVAYGSTVRGDHSPGFSDTNLLLVLEDLSVSTLQMLFEPVREWVANKNSVPLLFTNEQLPRSLDVFPIEFSEIMKHHRVLVGNDPFEGTNVKKTNVRWQLEYELRVKSLTLRRLFLENAKEPAILTAILAKATSSLTALMRAILMMRGEPVPTKQSDVWSATEKLTGVDMHLLTTVQEIRMNLKKKGSAKNEAEDLFGGMLKILDGLIRFVDALAL